MTDAAVTPAMRKRLRQLAIPGTTLTRPRLHTTTFSFHGPTASGGMTYIMVDKLEEAGLIRFVPDYTMNNPSQVKAELTSAGKAAL